ncbi:MAG: TetR/AcrR family transcriptional regulator, partial [Ardenticatenaceae bacterium]
MAPRDEQEYETRRQQIIDGALQVFSKKGFEKATNRDIASAAGIGSPGLIYHYFKDKRDLFQNVIEERSAGLQLLLHSESMMELPPREVLTKLATTCLMMTIEDRSIVALFRLILGESLRRPALAAMLSELGPQRMLVFLQRYFLRQMELGVLREMDPGAAARTFIGPLIAYVLTREVFPQ